VDHLAPSLCFYSKGSTLSVQPQQQPLRLIPATIDSGFAKGKTTEKILVDPKTGIHYCTQEGCDYSGKSFGSVRGHMGGHSERKSSADSLGKRLDRVATELVDIRDEMMKVKHTNATAEWKDRALKAERRLATLRRALGMEQE
jgi:hypothetical protein